jgi:hypothetical protein
MAQKEALMFESLEWPYVTNALTSKTLEVKDHYGSGMDYALPNPQWKVLMS